MERLRLTSEGPHPAPDPRRGPHLHPAGEVGVAPVMDGLIGNGRNSYRAVHTDAAAQPADNGGANQMTAVPDLLDDEAAVMSQALVPVDKDLVPVDNDPPVTTAPPTPATAAATDQIESTPVIAGLGKIERNDAPRRAPKKRERIIVPERSINGGLEFKFEPDPYGVDLCDLMTADEYTDAITTLNDKLRPSRSKKVDTGLLITGPLIVPLAVWGVRHSRLVKKRKRLLVEGIQDFNDSHPTLYMRYNRSGAGSSFLSIEHKPMMTGVEESWMNREPVV